MLEQSKGVLHIYNNDGFKNILQFRCNLYQIYTRFKMMIRTEEMIDQNQAFEVQEVVWAKVTGYPWWPATISTLPSEDNNIYRVDFLHDSTHAFLKASKIIKYKHYRYESNGKNKISSALKKAISLANELQVKAEDNVSLAEFSEELNSSKKNSTQLFTQQEVEKQCSGPKNHQCQRKNFPIYRKGQLTPQEKEKVIYSILQKYNLHNINPISSKKPDRRCKATKKNIQNNQQRQVTLMARLIYRLLRKKASSDFLLSSIRHLSLVLAQLVQKEKKKNSLLRQLTKWIHITPIKTVEQFHQQWISCHRESDKDKSSSITTED